MSPNLGTCVKMKGQWHRHRRALWTWKMQDLEAKVEPLSLESSQRATRSNVFDPTWRHDMICTETGKGSPCGLMIVHYDGTMLNGYQLPSLQECVRSAIVLMAPASMYVSGICFPSFIPFAAALGGYRILLIACLSPYGLDSKIRWQNYLTHRGLHQRLSQ
jgi:hypothetical protein